MHNFEDTKNYYEVLEIKTDATLQDIHTAYTRSKNAYSTDSAALYSLMSTNECERIVEQIEEAYTILGTAEKRREYDKVRGFNQTHTPEGFTEEFLSKPDYMPQNTLNAQPVENPLVAEAVKEKALKEEFKYQQKHSTKTGSTVSKVQAVNKFGLNFQKNESFEQDIENCTNYTGAFLSSVRDYKQVTVERMAEMTKISKTYIRNIEADEFSKLPADVYTRGFVYQYAKCLKLNPDLVATSYIHNLRMLKNPS